VASRGKCAQTMASSHATCGRTCLPAFAAVCVRSAPQVLHGAGRSDARSTLDQVDEFSSCGDVDPVSLAAVEDWSGDCVEFWRASGCHVLLHRASHDVGAAAASAFNAVERCGSHQVRDVCVHTGERCRDQSTDTPARRCRRDSCSGQRSSAPERRPRRLRLCEAAPSTGRSGRCVAVVPRLGCTHRLVHPSDAHPRIPPPRRRRLPHVRPAATESNEVAAARVRPSRLVRARRRRRPRRPPRRR
jgi:hypothetical protein